MDVIEIESIIETAIGWISALGGAAVLSIIGNVVTFVKYCGKKALANTKTEVTKAYQLQNATQRKEFERQLSAKDAEIKMLKDTVNSSNAAHRKELEAVMLFVAGSKQNEENKTAIQKLLLEASSNYPDMDIDELQKEFDVSNERSLSAALRRADSLKATLDEL